MIKIIIQHHTALNFSKKKAFWQFPYLNKLEANVGNVNDLLNIIEHIWVCRFFWYEKKTNTGIHRESLRHTTISQHLWIKSIPQEKCFLTKNTPQKSLFTITNYQYIQKTSLFANNWSIPLWPVKNFFFCFGSLFLFTFIFLVRFHALYTERRNYIVI